MTTNKYILDVSDAAIGIQSIHNVNLNSYAHGSYRALRSDFIIQFASEN